MDDSGNALAAAQKFMVELRKMSVHPDACERHVVAEWKVVNGGKHASHCICDTRIENLFYIQNKLNNNTATIGSSCVRRWEIECDTFCDRCEEKFEYGLGISRRCSGNLTCKKCAAKARKKAKDDMKRAEEEMIYLSRWTMYFPGPWQNLSFKRVAENEEWIGKLLNMHDRQKDKSTTTLKGFFTYCSYLGYSLE
jgi:hypothetical protein